MTHATDILKGIDELPPLPQVSTQVLRLVSDKEHSRNDLVQAISTDPALTAKILSLCNSSLFALRHEVTTVSDAIGFIGSTNLVNLVVSTCMSSYFRDGDEGYVAKPGDIWQHGVASAIAAQLIAKTSGASDPGTAFTAGILHNIGKIALGQHLVRLSKPPRLEAPAEDFLSMERGMMGIDHCEAGATIARSWGLPDHLAVVCGSHHDPDAARSLGSVVAVVHVADILVMQAGIGHGIDHLTYDLDDAVLDRISLPRNAIGGIVVKLLEELSRSQDLVKLHHAVGR